MSLTRQVIDANIAVHSRLAAQYESSEPHFRAENVAKVTRRLAHLVAESRAERLLDLGCGTGFIIGIAKPYVREIVGVDVTQAMLDRVDTSGTAAIELVNCDTGTYDGGAESFELVTAYSFLHHLAELEPTLRTASRALVAGGKFYADLEPNWYFWESLRKLSGREDVHQVVQREILGTMPISDEVQQRLGIARHDFTYAEFGKSVAGGFQEEQLEAQLRSAGFSHVAFHYDWFLGEGFLINSGAAPRDELLKDAAAVSAALQRALPVSRPLFKYLGFVATK